MQGEGLEQQPRRVGGGDEEVDHGPVSAVQHLLQRAGWGVAGAVRVPWQRKVVGRGRGR